MKSLFFSFVVIILDVAACGSGPGGNYKVEYLEIYPKTVTIESQKGSSGVISISSNKHWIIVSEKVQWLKVFPTSGDGDETITVTALTSNQTINSRSCTLIIDGRKKVIVTQKCE